MVPSSSLRIRRRVARYICGQNRCQSSLYLLFQHFNPLTDFLLDNEYTFMALQLAG